jgi:hypothetical protein
VVQNNATSDAVVVPVWTCDNCLSGVESFGWTEVAFGPAHPDPTSGTAWFDVALPKPANVQLTVFDLAGRQVGTPIVKALGVGQHQLAWSAPEHRSGVFFARAQVNGRTVGERRIVVMR